jgi:hypothetical protein
MLKAPQIMLSMTTASGILSGMANAKIGRPSSGKKMVQCRIDPANLVKLDELARQFVPVKLSRSQMIDLAVAEYVERHTGKKKER